MMNLKALLLTSAVVAMLMGCSNEIPAMNPAGHTHDGTDTNQNITPTPSPSPSPSPTTGGGNTAFSTAATFEIAAGNGAKDWNTSATPIQVAVGGTVTFVNKDSITHQIHTNSTANDAFNHGNPIAPGASVTYTVRAAFDNTKPITNGSTMYSHIDGTGTHIYFQSK